ncbi:CrcB family protein [Solwaraspora sp. WMMD406]|uniref:fluoride efflux transporter FluC n=1 Tax=Solwaraspora sp. WMMD406 TaxID=3016095 RepID=UPI00241799A8|nr:CrcB family protein [Solwaraspora sp. WMMD406]MDG4763088.1 CrcB family protein [Solwaraspora sp. WMMD406]
MTGVLLVMLGGAAGALLRYLVDRLAVGSGRPSYQGTFIVNLVGAVLLGLLAGAGMASDGWVWRLLGSGFCGALTTYSTFAYEVVQLAGGSRRDRLRTVGYATGTLTFGFAGLVAGVLVMSTETIF